ncbi:hypothetical protein [Bacillus sp. Marseille-P3661]|uniref:hypothetical protein n=1 Tax=Bacillus sp. Marseille-P3661 TaxID=1936234 RepID=UPI000C858224|nr:hypothetical protein [Bacillus sp. Marseille-P3661]
MKKFLKGVSIATALTFTVSPLVTSPVSAIGIEDLVNLKMMSNTLKATFNVSEPIASETVTLNWMIDESLTNSDQTFEAISGKPYYFSVHVTPGNNILDGIIPTEKVAILLKVPNNASNPNPIEGVYPSSSFFSFEQSELGSVPSLVDPTGAFTYYVLAEDLFINYSTYLDITSEIVFNTAGTYSDFEVIAVQDPIELFSVIPGGPSYATFTLDTQGNTGTDLNYPNMIHLTQTGGPVSHGDFEFELVSVDRLVGENRVSLDLSVLESINIYKNGYSYEIEPFDTTQYTDRPVVTIKVSGKDDTAVAGLSHTIQIEEGAGKDFRYVIAIDGNEVLPTFPLLR